MGHCRQVYIPQSKNGSLQKWSITGQHIQPAQLQRLPTLVQGRPICFFLRGNPTTNSSQTKGQNPFYTFFPWPAIKHAAGTRKCLGWKAAGDLPNLLPHGPILGTRRLGPASNPLALQHADGFIGMVFFWKPT